jgi:hypothetical protein
MGVILAQVPVGHEDVRKGGQEVAAFAPLHLISLASKPASCWH